MPQRLLGLDIGSYSVKGALYDVTFRTHELTDLFESTPLRLEEIEEQSWSLNPGRYVGIASGKEKHDEDFSIQLETLQEELEVLNSEAHELEKTINDNVAKILGAV